MLKIHCIAPVESRSSIGGAHSGEGYIEHVRSLFELAGISHFLTDDHNKADIIFVLEPCVIYDYRSYAESLISHPVIKACPGRCYTYNSIDRPWPILPGMYVSLDKTRADPWLHCGGPHIHFPNGHANRASNSYGNISPEQRNLACFRGSQTSNIRRKLFKAAGAGQFSTAVKINKSYGSFFANGEDGQKKYVAEILGHAFSLAPAGHGPSTFRIYESMALGRAPVIIADSWMPPNGISWVESCLIIPESDLTHIEPILEGEAHRAMALGSSSKEIYEENFSPERVMNYVVKSIARLHNNNPYPHDPAWRTNWINRAASTAPAPPLQNKIIRAARKARHSIASKFK